MPLATPTPAIVPVRCRGDDENGAVIRVVPLDQVGQSRDSMQRLTPTPSLLRTSLLFPASKTSVSEIFTVFHWRLAMVEKTLQTLHVRVVLILSYSGVLHTTNYLTLLYFHSRSSPSTAKTPQFAMRSKQPRRAPVFRMNRLRPLIFMLCVKAAAGSSPPTAPRLLHLSLISSIPII